MEPTGFHDKLCISGFQATETHPSTFGKGKRNSGAATPTTV